MSGRTTNIPLGVDVALCQRELKRDRREMRTTRTAMEEQRIRASMAATERAFATKATGAVAEMLGKGGDAVSAGSRLEQVVTKDVGGALEKSLQEDFEQLRKGAAVLRNAGMGEDVATKASSELSTQLSKLKRPRS